MKCAIRDGFIDATVSVFDYGCGHGQDIEMLTAQGIPCEGWDPIFRPTQPRSEADVVNLGYVINVIEDAEERAATLQQAWQLCRRLLVVSAQVMLAGRGHEQVCLNDGVLTGRGTFQKFYEQGELKAYLEAQLGTEPVPAALGIFYVFKDESLRQQFLAHRFRRRSATPRKRLSEVRFEENRDLLEPFLATLTALGRLPVVEEFPQAAELQSRFGSLKRAFALVRRVTGPAEWDTIRQRRTEDLLVYLALARFGKRPPLSQLPRPLQRDLRAFFGTYTRACRTADELLF
jgi:DNA phosphorothioation-associated putative methyltransferase